MAAKRIVVFIGPSGSGKSAVVTELVNQGVINLVPTYTTRPRRLSEAGAQIDHVFVDEVEFDSLEVSGKFLATTRMFSLPYRYGLQPVSESSEIVSAVMLRAEFVEQFRHFYSSFKVYQIEVKADVAAARVALRDDPLHIGDRIARIERELEAGRLVADRVFEGEDTNGTIDAVAKALIDDF